MCSRMLKRQPKLSRPCKYSCACFVQGLVFSVQGLGYHALAKTPAPASVRALIRIHMVKYIYVYQGTSNGPASFRVQGFGFRVQGLGHKHRACFVSAFIHSDTKGSGFRVQGLVYRPASFRHSSTPTPSDLVAAELGVPADRLPAP